MMNIKAALLVFGICSTLLCSTEATSLTLCPNEDLARKLVGTSWIDAPGQPTVGLIRRTRLPQVGLYDDYLTCIMITDTSVDNTGGQVTITDGGLNHKYVEVRLNSGIGKPLDYLILVYTNRASYLFNSTMIF